VLGSPIAHSLSPVLHGAAYSALGLTGWRFEALECAEAELPGVLAARPDWAGFACTMPLKRAVLQVATTVSEPAAAIGAGNTLLPGATGWHADNTDWIGIRDALAAAGAGPPGRVVLLGAGGTAQAALAALPAGCEITALVREPGRAGALLAAADRLGRPVRLGRLGEPVPADLVIATLPAGAADPLAATVPDWTMPPGWTLLDVVYAGWPTPLARAARQAGARLVSGAAMLLFQAARQVELMTGRAAPVEAMRAAMRAAAPASGC